MVLLIVLRFFLYKPLLKLLADRKKKIEEGVEKAKMADVRLLEANETSKEKIREAEKQAIGIIQKTENDAKVLEAKLMSKAKEKEEAELKDFQGVLLSKEDASRRALDDEAKKLVKMAIVKTVALSPDLIDDALIAQAIKEIKKTG